MNSCASGVHGGRFASRPCVAPRPMRLSSRLQMRCSVQPDNTDEIESTWKMLKDYSLKEFKKAPHDYIATREARDKMRAAVKAVYDTPFPPAGWNKDGEYGVLIGMMAGSSKMGVRALRDWCQEFDIEYMIPENKVPNATSLATVEGPVYLKINPRIKLCYLSPYLGQERGVLLQLGQEQLGHFPLGLWDEDQKNPPPPGL